ncbi:uncharacterized protein LOC133037119 [Cannabis sativa]|uniref:uncharacterized protein LOC133037119 n=1 Tax=Cannabis sativa TaxID=3483 RepID=UPI0029CA879D|nr:uncharacterized protein LOC133037119 [Cannabis sativa]
MASGRMIPFQILMLTKSNYDNWSDKEHDDVALSQAQRDALGDSRKRDKKALYLIYQVVNEDAFEKISNATTAKEAWEKLQACNKGAEQVKKIRLQALRCDFETLFMEDTESISNYFTRALSIVNQLRKNGEEINEVKVIEKILHTVSPTFEYIATIIEENKDLEPMNIEQLMGSLQAYEEKPKRKKKGNEKMEQLLKLTLEEENSNNGKDQKGRGRDQRSERRRGRGQRREGRGDYNNNNFNIGEQSRNSQAPRGCARGNLLSRSDKSHIMCYNCNKYGHYASKCRSRRVEERANFVKVDKGGEERTLLLAYKDKD